MDRRAWLPELRAAVELDYTRSAPDYEAGNYPISETHRHFYASDEQVTGWLAAAGLNVVDDVTDMSYGDWGYRHRSFVALRRDVVHAVVGGLADRRVHLG